MAFKDKYLLGKYQDSIEKVRLAGLKSNLSEREVNNAMEQCMGSLLVKENELKLKRKTSKWFLSSIRQVICVLKKIGVALLFFLVSIMILYGLLQHKPIQYFIQSNLQDFIYPGMKILRKLVLPVISLYPSLTSKWTRTLYFNHAECVV